METKTVRLTPELADAIDAWRATQAGLPPRAEAARRLIGTALAAEKSEKPAGKK